MQADRRRWLIPEMQHKLKGKAAKRTGDEINFTPRHVPFDLRSLTCRVRSSRLRDLSKDALIFFARRNKKNAGGGSGEPGIRRGRALRAVARLLKSVACIPVGSSGDCVQELERSASHITSCWECARLVGTYSDRLFICLNCLISLELTDTKSSNARIQQPVIKAQEHVLIYSAYIQHIFRRIFRAYSEHIFRAYIQAQEHVCARVCKVGGGLMVAYCVRPTDYIQRKQQH